MAPTQPATLYSWTGYAGGIIASRDEGVTWSGAGWGIPKVLAPTMQLCDRYRLRVDLRDPLRLYLSRCETTYVTTTGGQ